MVAKILDGRTTAEKIKLRIKEKILAHKLLPGLAVILVGSNLASQSYIKQKQNACKAVGIISHLHHLPENTDQQTLEKLILNLNNDSTVHGILLQLPLPLHLQTDELLEKINPKKVVVGASNIVGRPMALELLIAQCTVTICHSATKNLAHHVQEADILISATGHHGIIHSEWIKPGAIVIDVGFSRLNNGKITGDIDFETACTRAGWITPVPGGVGPMTVATLLENTVMAAEIPLALS